MFTSRRRGRRSAAASVATGRHQEPERNPHLVTVVVQLDQRPVHAGPLLDVDHRPEGLHLHPVALARVCLRHSVHHRLLSYAVEVSYYDTIWRTAASG